MGGLLGCECTASKALHVHRKCSLQEEGQLWRLGLVNEMIKYNAYECGMPKPIPRSIMQCFLRA